MGGFNTPNFNQFIAEAWGWDGYESAFAGFSQASNVVVGANPPFTIADFLGFYPQFGGNPLVLTGTITLGSPVITGLTVAGILPGMAVSTTIPLGNDESIPGLFAPGTTVLSLDSATQITVSNSALNSGGQIAIFNTPFVPVMAMIAFVSLASSSLMEARWQDMWTFAMCLFVAHYCTLYLRANDNPVTSAGQLVVAGLEKGITVNKSGGPVSQGIQLSSAQGGLEAWGAWQETTFGMQLITMARSVGAGPMWLY